ncbi:hypothetical protein NFI96_017368, partial [Prochilodus magdalenae]
QLKASEGSAADELSSLTVHLQGGPARILLLTGDAGELRGSCNGHELRRCFPRIDAQHSKLTTPSLSL